MNHAQKIVYLGNLLRTNLDAKGVTVNQNATMKEMIDSILDIPPVTVGISLSSSLNLSVPSNIKYYDTVVLTATLTVFYDDTSQTNVDMHGTLQGATVIFKDGQNNTIGSAITDINGVATYNITANSSSMEYYAVFSGTDDYSSSTSNHVTINPQHDYNLEFSQDIYLASSGSATVSCTLTDNGVPVPNATVSLSGSDGSLYTGITNSSGIASVTVSNVSSETTFTCSYQGVSDTCTVTATVYLINDDASVDNSSTLFGDSVVLRNSGTNTTAWNNGGYYTVKNTRVSSESMRVIAPLTGLTGDFTLEYDSYLESTDGASGFVIYNSSTSFVGLLNDGSTYTFFYNDGSYHETNLSSGVTQQEWVHFKFIVEGTNFTLECYENDVLQYTATKTIHFNRSSSTMYGFEVKWTSNRITRYKNIKAEAL